MDAAARPGSCSTATAAGLRERVEVADRRVDRVNDRDAVELAVPDVRVRVAERQLRRDTVAAEVALVDLQLDALRALVADVDAGHEVRALIEDEVLDLVLRLTQERRELQRHIARELLLIRDVEVVRLRRDDPVHERVAQTAVREGDEPRHCVRLHVVVLLERVERRLRVPAVAGTNDRRRVHAYVNARRGWKIGNCSLCTEFGSYRAGSSPPALPTCCCTRRTGTDEPASCTGCR